MVWGNNRKRLPPFDVTLRDRRMTAFVTITGAVLPHSWHLDPCKTTSPTRPIKVATRTRQDDARPTGKDRVLLSRGSLVRVQPGALFKRPVGLEGQIRREHCECKGSRTGPLGFDPARKRGPGRAELQGDRNAGRPQGDTEHPGGAIFGAYF